mmetsp:Transcript_14211/g.22202  ORF Transcript_14211/g.22202 Transcript_14211/m.22202 type:complete len:204 (+) Transcript_14211:2175-2786(+)
MFPRTTVTIYSYTSSSTPTITSRVISWWICFFFLTLCGIVDFFRFLLHLKFVISRASNCQNISILRKRDRKKKENIPKVACLCINVLATLTPVTRACLPLKHLYIARIPIRNGSNSNNLPIIRQSHSNSKPRTRWTFKNLSSRSPLHPILTKDSYPASPWLCHSQHFPGAGKRYRMSCLRIPRFPRYVHTTRLPASIMCRITF